MCGCWLLGVKGSSSIIIQSTRAARHRSTPGTVLGTPAILYQVPGNDTVHVPDIHCSVRSFHAGPAGDLVVFLLRVIGGIGTYIQPSVSSLDYTHTRRKLLSSLSFCHLSFHITRSISSLYIWTVNLYGGVGPNPNANRILNAMRLLLLQFTLCVLCLCRLA